MRVTPLIVGGLFCACLIAPIATEAHQPRLVVEETEIQVVNPEVSQAFYAELNGTPETFILDEEEPFNLYVGLLVPDLPGIETDLKAGVFEVIGETEVLMFLLDGEADEWEPYYEEFGGDDYLTGPEGEQQVNTGRYLVRVSSTDNQGKYVLVIGRKESFPPAEIMNTARVLPQIKKEFFGKPAASALWNVMGAALFMMMVIVAGSVVFIVIVVRRRGKRGTKQPAKKRE